MNAEGRAAHKFRSQEYRESEYWGVHRMERGFWATLRNAWNWRHVDMVTLNDIIEHLKKENAELRVENAQLLSDRIIASDKLSAQLQAFAQKRSNACNALRELERQCRNAGLGYEFIYSTIARGLADAA